MPCFILKWGDVIGHPGDFENLQLQSRKGEVKVRLAGATSVFLES